MQIRDFNVTATSLVNHNDQQLIVLEYNCSVPVHLKLRVLRDGEKLITEIPVALNSGNSCAKVFLPLQQEGFHAQWQLIDAEGNILAKTQAYWKIPRHWTIYAMISSHTDIGLHNSQYIQRANSIRFVDAAAKLCDETENRPEEDRYRYVMEGTWFWNNYVMDKGEDAARRIVDDYINPGKIGLCGGIAGNHYQTYGLEEMCRGTYGRKALLEKWGIDCHTMSMIDNNGMPMSMIQPFSDAGFENIIFAPNQWNPLPSTIWQYDKSKIGFTHNSDAAGGGSRVDVRYESHLPLVFNWEDGRGNAMTVWASTQYDFGGSRFGFYCRAEQQHARPDTVTDMYRHLELLEARYPYDLWLFACYYDDQEPDLFLTDCIKDWNAQWKWPKLRTLGDPDEPFRLLKQRFGDQIPVLKGDITGGWYQHPLTVPELMSQKYEADRSLANAETYATLAAVNAQLPYPKTQLDRAWEALLLNDEHSYGTSGYQGRRVYETWLQHRDWIDKAENTAREVTAQSLQAIAGQIRADEDAIAVFNPTLLERREYVQVDDIYALASLPPLGYRVLKTGDFKPVNAVTTKLSSAPVIENRYYRIAFQENGSLCSVYDKQLSRELLDQSCPYGANELVYTKDNHKSFLSAEKAEFTLKQTDAYTQVQVRTEIAGLGADILQTLTLPSQEKRIDIDNRLDHVRDLFNPHRYYRYLYYAFPFLVENSRRLCHLNGAVAEYGKDVTGHGTDVYMDVREWCCCENEDFGVALLMLDSHVTEFDHIHPDKTDFSNPGKGSQIYSYVANDWLQMHTSGGDHLDYRFRYCITSYPGDHTSAGIAQLAERYCNPVATAAVKAGCGRLPADSHSFMQPEGSARLLCLKQAEDGNGIIARFYGKRQDISLTAQAVSVDERPVDPPAKEGFLTYRLPAAQFPVQTDAAAYTTSPAPVGAYYTGLVTKPRAAAGEHQGHLYLLWGANMEESLSHYRLYRSETPGFTACDDTFLADIQPEPEYRVGRYEDTGLKIHHRYYYRVCAVNKEGQCGPLSEEFSAITRQPYQEV